MPYTFSAKVANGLQIDAVSYLHHIKIVVTDVHPEDIRNAGPVGP